MGSAYRIPVAVFFLLCFSFSSFAKEKVYTNEDLKPDSSLNRISGEHRATGKENDPKDGSRNTRDLERIVTSAKHTATRFIREVKTNRTLQAAIIVILLLIWTALLLDIVRFEFRGNNKLIWFIAVTFIPVIGWILYLFVGRRQKKYKFIRDYE